MIDLFREMVTTLRAMDFDITVEDANKTWKRFKEVITKDVVERASDLLISRKEWANLPSLEKCFDDVLNEKQEGIDGANTTGVKAEESGVQDRAGSGEGSVTDIRDHQSHQVHRDSIVHQGHDSSPGPCCRSGVVFARLKREDGVLNQLTVFRCACRMGMYQNQMYPLWQDQRDFEKE